MRKGTLAPFTEEIEDFLVSLARKNNKDHYWWWSFQNAMSDEHLQWKCNICNWICDYDDATIIRDHFDHAKTHLSQSGLLAFI